MEKKKRTFQAVVAHAVPREQQRIASILEKDGLFHVRHTTHDGLECVREVVATQPDLLVIDTVLDKIDGLEVLRRLKEFPLAKTKCLMLSTYGGYIPEYTQFLGADYCLIAPFADGVLRQSAQMLVLPPKNCYSQAAIDRETVRLLREIGVPDRLKAYAYTLDGVRILLRDPDLVRRRRVIKELYDVIGLHFDVPGWRVERTMRTLANRLFDKGNLEHLARYFSPVYIRQGHVTNTEYLTTVAGLVRERLAASEAQGRSGQAAEN